jgi:regulator of protease activity HflC (stomatin/prohibitin superfamily)
MRKSIFGLIMLAMVAMFTFSSCGYERIDAGHVGIKVNLYGNDKGVDDVTEVTGAVWYNPFRTKIFETPTYVQNAIWTANKTEGSESNEEFRLTTKDGMEIAIDVSLNYLVPADNAVTIFKKYRKPLDVVANTVLRNYTRDGYNSAASEFTAEEVYSNRNEFKAVADSLVTNILESEGFQVEKLVLVNSIRLPNSIKESIERKIQARQIALQKQMELEQAQADADKKIEKARGEAESMRIQADAERYAYEQKQRALTKLLVQQQFIEKWDGALPTYGAVPELFKGIQ